MRVRKASLLAVPFAVFALASSAAAVEHGSFGLGLNTSLSSSLIANNNPGVGASGVVSFRAWLTPNFAIDPQFGFSLLSVENGATTFGFVVGSRFLYSVANTQSLRFNVGGEFMFDIASVSAGAGAGNATTTVPGLLFGPLIGVEYFFAELKNLSFEVYLGLPIAIFFPENRTTFAFGIGGNIIAGFHYYF